MCKCNIDFYIAEKCGTKEGTLRDMFPNRSVVADIVDRKINEFRVKNNSHPRYLVIDKSSLRRLVDSYVLLFNIGDTFYPDKEGRVGRYMGLEILLVYNEEKVVEIC